MTPTLHQQLRGCEKGIENLINAIQMGILTSSTKERLEELEKQREALKLSLLQAQMERPKYSKEYIVSWISRFKYGNIHDKAYRKEIIDIFVNSVYLYDDHIVFTYNFKDGNQTLTLQEIESALCSDLTSSASPNRNHPNFAPIGQCSGDFCFYGGLQRKERKAIFLHCCTVYGRTGASHRIGNSHNTRNPTGRLSHYSRSVYAGVSGGL